MQQGFASYHIHLFLYLCFFKPPERKHRPIDKSLHIDNLENRLHGLGANKNKESLSCQYEGKKAMPQKMEMEEETSNERDMYTRMSAKEPDLVSRITKLEMRVQQIENKTNIALKVNMQKDIKHFLEKIAMAC